MIEAVVGGVIALLLVFLVGGYAAARSKTRRVTAEMSAREKAFLAKPAVVLITPEQMELLGSLIASVVQKHLDSLKVGPHGPN